MEAEAGSGESGYFLRMRKRMDFDERGWRRKQTRKRKCSKGAGSGSDFFKIRRFRIFKLATTVGVKCYNNNNNIKSTTRAWNGMENGTERKFRYGIWKMPEWNGMEDFKNGRQISILPYQFHTRFCALYLQKNTYWCQVGINNIVTEIFNFNIYAYYLSTNCGTLFVYIAQTAWALHHMHWCYSNV